MKPLALIIPLALIPFALARIRPAEAQPSAPFAATVYVPSDGLVFRTFEGHLVARLSYGDHGGRLELFDENEQIAPALPPLKKADIQERVRKEP